MEWDKRIRGTASGAGGVQRWRSHTHPPNRARERGGYPGAHLNRNTVPNRQRHPCTSHRSDAGNYP
ncbi:MAG: hypothetical protein OHK0046_11740 [Anaerolineae bacterium]